MSPTSHRWAAVALRAMDEDEATELAAAEPDARLDMVCDLFGPTPEGLHRALAVRGPICRDCRVSWEDVHRDTKPWPCPGAKPEAFGGTLFDPPSSRPAETRQQRRAKRREAEKLTQRRDRKVSAEDIKASMDRAVSMARVRQRERETEEATT